MKTLLQPIDNMNANMGEVQRLIEMHGELTGSDRGRRHRVEVLNKSAIVLITACWEALVEDLASDAFDFTLNEAKDPNQIPAKVRVAASRNLRQSQDESKVWSLAGDGWRQVLRDHRDSTPAKSVGALNSPKSNNVDSLFNDLLGMPAVSSQWSRHHMKAQRAREKLNEFVILRGTIAHRVSTSGSVKLAQVVDYRAFVFRLAVKTSNAVRVHVHQSVGRHPWNHWSFGSVE